MDEHNFSPIHPQPTRSLFTRLINQDVYKTHFHQRFQHLSINCHRLWLMHPTGVRISTHHPSLLIAAFRWSWLDTNLLFPKCPSYPSFMGQHFQCNGICDLYCELQVTVDHSSGRGVSLEENDVDKRSFESTNIAMPPKGFLFYNNFAFSIFKSRKFSTHTCTLSLFSSRDKKMILARQNSFFTRLHIIRQFIRLEIHGLRPRTHKPINLD